MWGFVFWVGNAVRALAGSDRIRRSGLRFDVAWPLVGLRREVVLQAASAACETLAPNRGREESHVSW